MTTITTTTRMLSELEDDALGKVFEAFVADRTGVALVWKLVCQAMRRVAPPNVGSWLQAVGVSVNLAEFARTLPMAASRCGLTSDQNIVCAVAYGNHCETLHALRQKQWAKDTKLLKPDPKRIDGVDTLLSIAITAGGLSTVKLLASWGMHLGHHAACIAARHGHLDIFNWLLLLQEAKDALCDFRYCVPIATFSMHRIDLQTEFDALVFGIEQAEPFEKQGTKDGLMTAAAKGGNLDLVRKLYDAELKRESDPFEYDHEPLFFAAAQCDHLHIVAWAATKIENGDDVLRANWACADAAVRTRSFKVLKWAAERMGNDFEPDVFLARCDDDYKVAKFMLDELKLPASYRMMCAAVKHETSTEFEAMEYVHSKDCPKYASVVHEHRLDVYARAVLRKNKLGGIRIVRWLRDHGYAVEGSPAMHIAICEDNLSVFEVLLSLGFAFPSDYFAPNGPGRNVGDNWDKSAVVKWARAHGFDIPAYDNADAEAA